MNDGVDAVSGRVATADGLELFYRGWLARRPRGAIALVHGLAEHSARYEPTGRFLAKHDWSVLAVDLRGHGHSPDGRRPGRVHIDRFADYGRDVDALGELLRDVGEGLPRFLFGHSMGGLIALTYLLQNPEAYRGGIVSSPALAPHPDSLPPRIVTWIARILSRLAPRKRFASDIDPALVSRDPDVVRAYAADPLISRRVSARWYVEMTVAMGAALDRAGELAVPLLLMQSGADRLVDPEAAPDWARRAPAGRVDYEHWEGFFHEMLNEPEQDRARVRRRILEWLAAHGETGSIALAAGSAS